MLALFRVNNLNNLLNCVFCPWPIRSMCICFWKTKRSIDSAQ